MPARKGVVLFSPSNAAETISAIPNFPLVIFQFGLLHLSFVVRSWFYLLLPEVRLQLLADISANVSTELYYFDHGLLFYGDVGQQSQLQKLLLVIFEISLFEVSLKNEFLYTVFVLGCGEKGVELALASYPSVNLL